MVHDIIQNTYLILVANITLLLFIIFNSAFSFKRKFPFLLAACISLTMIVNNIVHYYFSGDPNHLALLRFTSFISYLISGPIIVPFIYVTGVIRKHIRVIMVTCVICNAVLSFISIFTGCIFSYDENAKETLGMLSPIPFGLTAMYLAVLLYASFIKFRVGDKTESLFITVLSMCIVTATVLNIVFGYKYLVSGMAVLSTTFYYVFYSAQTLIRDALTNALNRHSFYKDINALSKKQMAVISMDLNGLKQINDTQGHDAGDRAILAVTECAVEVLPYRCRLYRMGGDEFEILCPNTPQEEAEALAAKLKNGVKAKKYSVAVGVADYQKGMDFEEVLRKADAIMYADKAEMKRTGIA